MGLYAYYEKRCVLIVGNQEEIVQNQGICIKVSMVKGEWYILNWMLEIHKLSDNSTILDFCKEYFSQKIDFSNKVPPNLLSKYCLKKLNQSECDSYETELYEEATDFPPEMSFEEVIDELKGFLEKVETTKNIIKISSISLLLYQNHWFVKTSDNQIYSMNDYLAADLCLHILDTWRYHGINDDVKYCYDLKLVSEKKCSELETLFL